MDVPSVKICGLTRREDAVAASQAGADHLGVILAHGYRRTVSPAQAAEILRDLPQKRVGVFVDAGEDEIARAAERLRLDVVQLHGDETPGLAGRLRERGVAVWKAVHVHDGGGLAVAGRVWAGSADALLLDGAHRAAPGGTGTRFPWEAVAPTRDDLPPGLRLVAAGGLTPGNVGEAVALLRPDVVDVSSGVERAPGVKEADAVRRFVAAARESGRINPVET